MLIVLAAALAGCTDAAPEPEAEEPEPTSLTVAGIVQDINVAPIAGATVTIAELGLNQTTGPDGRFAFTDLESRFHVVTASAPEYAPATLTVNPADVKELLFVLERIPATPFHITAPFAGFAQCAAEYLIITPSCDTILEFLADNGVPLPNNGSVTDDTTQFDVRVNSGWKTLVVDIVFDLADHPGLEAMRTVVSGTNDPNALTSYEQYGRFQSPTSYTVRIEPGGTYADGVRDVPQNSTGFRLDVYAQGHGWHATEDVIGLLGVGVAIDLQFEVFATAFYIEPAPVGWSFVA